MFFFNYSFHLNIFFTFDKAETTANKNVTCQVSRTSWRDKVTTMAKFGPNWYLLSLVTYGTSVPQQCTNPQGTYGTALPPMPCSFCLTNLIFRLFFVFSSNFISMTELFSGVSHFSIPLLYQCLHWHRPMVVSVLGSSQLPLRVIIWPSRSDARLCVQKHRDRKMSHKVNQMSLSCNDSLSGPDAPWE